MKEMKGIKALLVTAAIFTLFTCMTAISFADEGPFQDVSSDSYYYDAVNWLYENGIVSGNGKGTFRPDDAITHFEICCITDRINSSFFNNKESCYDGKAPGALFTRENAYYFADSLGILDPYPAWIWTGEMEADPKKDFLTAIRISGIFDGVSLGMNVTRGEYAHLIYCLVTGQYYAPDMDEIYTIPIKLSNQTDSWQLRNAVLTGLQCVPDSLIELFNRKNYSIELVDHITLRNYENEKVVGAFYPSQKKIQVSIESKSPTQTALHEFGHFTEKCLNMNSAEKILFSMESSQVTSITSSYSKANMSECFCNAFAEVLWDHATGKSCDDIIPHYAGYINAVFLSDETKAFSQTNAKAYMKSLK